MNLKKTAIALMIVFSTGAELPVVTQADDFVPGDGQQQPSSSQIAKEHGDVTARWAAALSLNPAQTGRIRDLVKKQRQEQTPLRRQIQEGRRQIRTVLQSEPLNEGALRTLIARQAGLRADMIIARISLKHQIFALLTPEQQKRAIAISALRERGPFHPPHHRQNMVW